VAANQTWRVIDVALKRYLHLMEHFPSSNTCFQMKQTCLQERRVEVKKQTMFKEKHREGVIKEKNYST
jgi:hypothetical protein